MQVDHQQIIRSFLATLQAHAVPINPAWIAYQVMIARHTTLQVEDELLQAGDGMLATRKTLVIRCSPDDREALRAQTVQAKIERAWRQCFPLLDETDTTLDVHLY